MYSARNGARAPALRAIWRQGIACGGAGKGCRRALLFRSATLLLQLRLRRQPSGEAAALLHLPLCALHVK
ncbi:MAG: hypothetical protein J2P37_18150, partial [Ktedonobacteraceae bacterium]|nr:hypothetical protein [Ktedonobacteraceae bacterium]